VSAQAEYIQGSGQIDLGCLMDEGRRRELIWGAVARLEEMIGVRPRSFIPLYGWGAGVFKAVEAICFLQMAVARGADPNELEWYDMAVRASVQRLQNSLGLLGSQARGYNGYVPPRQRAFKAEDFAPLWWRWEAAEREAVPTDYWKDIFQRSDAALRDEFNIPTGRIVGTFKDEAAKQDEPPAKPASRFSNLDFED
jgi:hypothetical protein